MRALVEREASLMLKLVAEALPAASEPVIFSVEDRVDIRGIVIIVEPAIVDVKAMAFGESRDEVATDLVSVGLEDLGHDLAGVFAPRCPVGIAIANNEPGLGFADDVLEHRIDPAREIVDADRCRARPAIAARASRLIGLNLGSDDIFADVLRAYVQGCSTFMAGRMTHSFNFIIAAMRAQDNSRALLVLGRMDQSPVCGLAATSEASGGGAGLSKELVYGTRN